MHADRQNDQEIEKGIKFVYQATAPHAYQRSSFGFAMFFEFKMFFACKCHTWYATENSTLSIK